KWMASSDAGRSGRKNFASCSPPNCPAFRETIGKPSRSFTIAGSASTRSQQLGCSEGAVATRLSRARKQLHNRLVRRGATLSACLAGVGAAQNTASAAVSVELILATVKVALGTEAASSGVMALIATGLQSPTACKLKIAVAVLLLSVSAGLGGTLAMLPGPAPHVPDVPPPDRPSAENRPPVPRPEPDK